jgi:hypothetical protein
MGTLRGFPNPPALWLRQAKPGYAYASHGTLRGFPNPPALWLRRAKPGYAYAGDGNPGDKTLAGDKTLERVPIAVALAGEACLSQCGRGNPRNASEEWRSGSANHFVSLCSVCFRHLLQNFDSLSFSAFARLFFVVE